MQAIKGLFVFVAFAVAAHAQHGVLAAADNRIVEYNAAGELVWEMPWPGGLHDMHLLANGNILTVRGGHEVVEIDRETKAVVWSYDAAASNGNEGKPIEIHAVQPLADGRVMIAESGPARIIEIDHEGTLLHVTPMTVKDPNPHRDTRLARKLANGNYLVCHEGDGVVREYAPDGQVVWDFPVPLFDKEPAPGHGPEAFGNQVFSALRLDNGNTLIGTGNGHSILEVTPEKEVVWAVHQNDLPDITLAWITTMHVAENGNIVFGNCHAGPGQPQIVEIAPKAREVIWTFSHYDALGNDLTNSILLNE